MRFLLSALLLLSSAFLVAGCEFVDGLLKKEIPPGAYAAELTIHVGDKTEKFVCVVIPEEQALADCQEVRED